MDDVFYSSMYGASPAKSAEPKTTPAPAAKVIPPAYQRLRGLKLTNSHMHEVDLGNGPVTIPSAAYIKLLEDQIKEFRSIQRSQGDEIRRATRAVNVLNRELEKVRTELTKTVKQNY